MSTWSLHPTSMAEYDFIDFGASKGGSLRFGANRFGGRGVGVDISPKKIDKLRESGGDGFVADATALDLPEGTFRYATLMNFLEHLPNEEIAAKALRQAVKVSREFVFVHGPNFDDLPYLASLGFKKCFADWHGHTWHHRVADFDRILKPLGLPYKIVEHHRIGDTSNPLIHPLSAAPDRGHYDPEIDPPKPTVKIKKRVFGWVTVVVAKSPDVDMADILCRSLGFRLTP